jgi:hypothetical protein
MPKYYVQSGTLQLVTTATDPRAAAIWAVHRTLAPSLPFLSGDCPGSRSLPPTARLEESICVSQRGFAGDDRLDYPTLAVVAEWTQLLVAVDRLQSRLAINC